MRRYFAFALSTLLALSALLCFAMSVWADGIGPD